MWDKDSPFYKKPPLNATPLEPTFPVRHVGRADIVEVPVKVLEDWSRTLDVLAEQVGGTGPQLDIEDMAEQMRSFFRG